MSTAYTVFAARIGFNPNIVSHLDARRRLRSSTTSALVAPRTVRFTIGGRTFPATAASVWNSLPESVRSSSSLQVFRSRLQEIYIWPFEVLPGRLFQEQRSVVGRSSILHWSHILPFATLRT